MKLLKILICTAEQREKKHSAEERVRRLINDIGFMERMGISAIEIYFTLAQRTVALQSGGQDANADLM